MPTTKIPPPPRIFGPSSGPSIATFRCLLFWNFFCVCELNFLRPPPPKHDTLRLFIGFVILHTICSVPLYSFVTFRVVCHWVALPRRRRFSLRATHILRQHFFRLFSDPTTHWWRQYWVNIRNSNLFLNPLSPLDDVVRSGEIIH